MAEKHDGRYFMSWDEVRQRLWLLGIDRPGNKVYPIPRGGFCAAAALKYAEIVFSPELADVILDDIRDSGRTYNKYKALFEGGVMFAALVDKKTAYATSESRLIVPTMSALQDLERAAERGVAPPPDFGTHRLEDDRNLGWVVFPWEDPEECGAEDGVVRILEFIGEDPQREGLQKTPGRVLRAFQEMTAGYHEDAAAVLGVSFEHDNADEMVVLRGIRFTSLCEHHLLPFSGEADVGYIPGMGRVVGLSKLARVVQVFAKRLQLQERLTAQVAEAIEKTLQPQGVAVVVRAKHACMGCRGALQPDAEMVTSAMLGAFREAPEARAEFLSLTQKPR